MQRFGDPESSLDNSLCRAACEVHDWKINSKKIGAIVDLQLASNNEASNGQFKTLQVFWQMKM